LDERKTRVAVLESDRDERAAELEEAQLRFAVGEFEEAEFQKHKSAHEDRLTALDADLKSDQDALAELEDVVGVLSTLGAGVGSAVRTGAVEPVSSGSAEKAEPTWGTARGRAEAEEGMEGAVVRTKSAAAAAAVAVADARAAETAEGEILESEEAVAEPEQADSSPESDEAAELEETAELATEETPAEAEADEAVDDVSEVIGESAADAAKAEGGDYLDDLEFLESLSMDEIDRLDAVSAMLGNAAGRVRGGGRREGFGEEPLGRPPWGRPSTIRRRDARRDGPVAPSCERLCWDEAHAGRRPCRAWSTNRRGRPAPLPGSPSRAACAFGCGSPT
jgi:hypothetical protein